MWATMVADRKKGAAVTVASGPESRSDSNYRTENVMRVVTASKEDLAMLTAA